MHRINALGKTTGELEDNILSVFNIMHMQNDAIHHVLLIDDFDTIVGSFDKAKPSLGRLDSDEGKESHSCVRAFYAFLAGMDAVARNHSRPENTVTLVCTARSNANVTLTRFDTVHLLNEPDWQQKRAALSKFLGFDYNHAEVPRGKTYDVELALDELAQMCIGLSFAEMAQNCRKAVIARDKADAGSNTDLSLLHALKRTLQSFTPASLRSGAVGGYVDIKVSCANDLLDTDQKQNQQCPLFGYDNELAWKELESNIVIPLCRAKELNLLLFNEQKAGVQGGLAGGIVLTGPPGSGKTILAQRCASFAASLNGSIKLLEVSCTSMIHKEVGASEKAIHHLFDCARRAAPCIVILDDVAAYETVETSGGIRSVSRLRRSAQGASGSRRPATAGLSIEATAIISMKHNAKRTPGRIPAVKSAPMEVLVIAP